MNEQDSSQMQALLAKSGYAAALDPFEADVILINTCAIRDKAVHKIYSDLGRIRPLKEDRPDLIVGIAGCVAEQEKQKLSERFPFLDLVLGPDHIRRLPEMIAEIGERSVRERETLHKTGFDLRKDFQFLNVLPNAEETPVKAFVNIQKGCDNICSFCIVPFVRGREVSRSHSEILDEIRELVDRGVKEVTLLGQNVNSYGLKTTGGATFSELLELIAEKTDLKRLRFTTSHPKDVKEDLVRQFRDNPILVPHFHLPVQSGSDRILNLMRRHYTRADYLDIIAKLKKAVPHIRFCTDIIVGFPGETDLDFQQTLSLIEEVRYDLVFSFVYSPRPFTKAKDLDDDVPYDVKLERLKILQDLTKSMAKEQNAKEVGLTHSVLVESRDDEAEHVYMGRTLSNKIVHFGGGDFNPGDFADVKITQAHAFSLFGVADDLVLKDAVNMVQSPSGDVEFS